MSVTKLTESLQEVVSKATASTSGAELVAGCRQALEIAQSLAFEVTDVLSFDVAADLNAESASEMVCRTMERCADSLQEVVGHRDLTRSHERDLCNKMIAGIRKTARGISEAAMFVG